MFCGKCGAEIPEGYEFCMKCGTKVEPSLDESQSDQKSKKNKKWYIPVIVVILIVAMAMGIIYFINGVKQKNGLYNGMQWGTTYEEVLAQLEKEKEETDTLIPGKDKKMVLDLVSDYNGDAGVSAAISYDCEDGNLHEITIMVMNDEETKFTDEMLVDKYEKQFRSLYGECEEESFTKVWTTKKSKIELTYLMDGMITISYEDIEMSE